MKFKLVKNKNVQRLHGALAELMGRNQAVPGLGVILGQTGAGKTTAIESAIAAFDAVFVRAESEGTKRNLLKSLCLELSIDCPWSNNDRYNSAVAELRARPRPIFIDEADYVARDGQLLDMLRDVHDITRSPVILIGMDEIERKLARRPQFARRISQRIEFGACDLADASLVAKELCEVGVAEDLVKKVHGQTKGSIGHMVIALTKIEELAKDNGWKAVNAEMWGKRPMFLGHRAD